MSMYSKRVLIQIHSRSRRGTFVFPMPPYSQTVCTHNHTTSSSTPVYVLTMLSYSKLPSEVSMYFMETPPYSHPPHQVSMLYKHLLIHTYPTRCLCYINTSLSTPTPHEVSMYVIQAPAWSHPIPPDVSLSDQTHWSFLPGAAWESACLLGRHQLYLIAWRPKNRPVTGSRGPQKPPPPFLPSSNWLVGQMGW
jgi:hypothetical protein